MADSPDPRDRVVHSIPLPEGAIPLSVVEIVEYLTPEGHRVYGYRHSGDTALSTTLGLIELAKTQIIEQADFT